MCATPTLIMQAWVMGEMRRMNCGVETLRVPWPRRSESVNPTNKISPWIFEMWPMLLWEPNAGQRLGRELTGLLTDAKRSQHMLLIAVINKTPFWQNNLFQWRYLTARSGWWQGVMLPEIMGGKSYIWRLLELNWELSGNDGICLPAYLNNS